MAGIRGRSGPPGNQNAFRHSLVGIAQRRADAVLNPQEQSFREEILSGLLADKGGAAQISTAMREPTISGLEISTDVLQPGKSGALCESSQTSMALIGATKAVSSNIFVHIPIKIPYRYRSSSCSARDVFYHPTSPAMLECCMQSSRNP